MLNVNSKEEYVELLRTNDFKPELKTGQSNFYLKFARGHFSSINAATRRNNILFAQLAKAPKLLLRNKRKSPSSINLILLTTESNLKTANSMVIKISLFKSRFSILIKASKYRLLNFFPIVFLHQPAY